MKHNITWKLIQMEKGFFFRVRIKTELARSYGFVVTTNNRNERHLFSIECRYSFFIHIQCYSGNYSDINGPLKISSRFYVVHKNKANGVFHGNYEPQISNIIMPRFVCAYWNTSLHNFIIYEQITAVPSFHSGKMIEFFKFNSYGTMS